MDETPLDIPAIRKALNLTQSQLADMAGVNLSTIWRWENDGIPKRGPARALLNRLNFEALSSPVIASTGDDAGALVMPPAQKGAPADFSNSPDHLPSGEAGARFAGIGCAPALVTGEVVR